jgi:hypothetical protein
MPPKIKKRKMSPISEGIVFQFGADKQQFTVPKQVLIDKSSVFERMFSGQFSNPPVITIEDIEADIFKQMIRCFNDEPVPIKRSDVFKLMYAAEKYMFDPLMKLCESFINALLNNNDRGVFFILESIQPFNCSSELKIKCLNIILDNPIKCFKDSTFLGIKADTLKMLLSEPKINCTVLTLLRAAKKWFVHNGQLVVGGNLNDVYAMIQTTFGIGKFELKSKRMFNTFALTVAEQRTIKRFQTNTEDIVINYGKTPKRYIHGIILNIGVYPEKENKNAVGKNYLTDKITIKFSIKHQRNVFKKVTRVITQTQSKPSVLKVSYRQENIILLDSIMVLTFFYR